MNRTVALIYTRVSKLDLKDRDRALSPATQLARCRELPALRGMSVEHYEDLDFSGKNTNRPQFQAMLERITRGDVAAVVAYSLSRVSRSVSDFYRLYEDVLQPADVAFISATEPIDTSSPQGRAFMGMTAVWAQMERELTSERLRDNFEQQARSGKLIGPVPLGYKRDGTDVVIDETEAPVVRTIFAQYATGKFSCRALAQWLNANGQLPPDSPRRHRNDRERARVWVADAISEILANERYVGRFVYRPRANPDGERIEGKYAALIDQETWSACATVRRRNHAQRTTHYDGRITRYALTGLLHCQRCGSTVHGLTRTRGDRGRSDATTYYSCRRRSGTLLCDQPLIRSERLEAQVRDWLAALCLPDKWREAFARYLGEPAHATGQTKARRLADMHRRLEKLRDLYELTDLTKDDYVGKRAELEAAISELKRQPAAATETLSGQNDRLTSLVDDWQALTAGEKRQLLDTIFTELVVDGQELVSATPRPGWSQHIDQVLTGLGFEVSPGLPLEGLAGIEPATPALGRRRSIH